jgi:Spy/CpxP family protein refolding chaperone
MPLRVFSLALVAILIAPLSLAQAVPDAAQLADRLGVSQSTAEAVHRALNESDRQPGFLRAVAESLAITLTSEQRAELVAAQRSVRPRANRPGWRADRQRGAMRGQATRGQAMRGQALRGQALRGQSPLPLMLESLTEHQRAQIQEMIAEHRPRMQALNRARRAGGADTAAIGEQIASLRSSMQADLESILTSEQLARLAELRAERRQQRPAVDGRRQRGVMRGDTAGMMGQQGARRMDSRQPDLRGGRSTGIRQARMTPERHQILMIHRALLRGLSDSSPR